MNNMYLCQTYLSVELHFSSHGAVGSRAFVSTSVHRGKNKKPCIKSVLLRGVCNEMRASRRVEIHIDVHIDGHLLYNVHI